MRPGKPSSAFFGLLVVMLSGCSAMSGGGETTSPTTGGAIELGVSETCAPASGAECVLVNGEHVDVIASKFVRAGIEDASALAEEGDKAIHVTFDDEGTLALQSTTAEVAEAGESGRLVIKIGDQMVSAVRVPAPLEGDEVQIVLPADADVRELIELIHAG